jgi:GMP synthase-like glutamine amidotransferase
VRYETFPEWDVLAVVHESDAGPGVFADAVRSSGGRLECWWPAVQARPSRGLDAYGAVLSFGGAMHPDAGEAYPWMDPERALLAECVARGIPTLGVCLGAQLLCQAAGGVARRAAEPEIGWYEVVVTDEGARDPVIGPLAPAFDALEWHSYECLPAAGAVTLARSDRYTQAFRVGTSGWGIQFHAEVTLRDFDSWVDHDRASGDSALGDARHDQLRAETHRRMAQWNALGRGLCERFLAVAAGLSPQAPGRPGRSTRPAAGSPWPRR